MHYPRLAAVLALAASLLPGAIASAAPRPVCNLLIDPANDVRILVPQHGPYPWVEPSIDIRSLDLVSDAQGIGLTLRLTGIGSTSTSTTHTGLGLPFSDYFVFFTIESMAREIGFHVHTASDNAYGYAYFGAVGAKTSFEVGRYLNDAAHRYEDEQFFGYGPAKGLIDEAKSEIRMSVTWTELKKYGFVRAKRDRAVKIRVRTQDWWVSNDRTGQGTDPGQVRYDAAPRDDAATNAAYVIGAKSCVTKL